MDLLIAILIIIAAIVAGIIVIMVVSFALWLYAVKRMFKAGRFGGD